MRSAMLLLLLLTCQAIAIPPRIAEGGIRNAASFWDPMLPGGGIARGSMFTIFGLDLGPTEGVHATAFPLPTELGGVQVSIIGGTEPLSAYLLYVSATQINAILPSGSPLEDVHLVVSYLGESGAPTEMRVARHAPGIFSFLQNGRGVGIITNYERPSSQPLNTPATPARPGQVITVWVTGLGASMHSDDQSPASSGDVRHLWGFDVFFGEAVFARAEYAGRSAQFAGLDQVNVTVPINAPTGCAVPIRISDLGLPSNTVTMAITKNGEPCGSVGKTYYLDCASGSDSNDGLSQASAWRTLVSVNGTVFQPGDSILLRRGTRCPLQLWPKGSGSPQAPAVRRLR